MENFLRYIKNRNEKDLWNYGNLNVIISEFGDDA
nr:MAG TPA: hypothetical protein [Caudoviricetes sp.]